VLSLAGLWLLGLMTPYLLLGRRLLWRRLAWQATLTAAGLTALGIWSAIYMPRAIASSASAYGTIGVAFALLTWLWGLGIVLVAAAVYGSAPLRWPPALNERLARDHEPLGGSPARGEDGSPARSATSDHGPAPG
jgi:uncharacterized BrkB/YihY/UPF0761 family membrane protein